MVAKSSTAGPLKDSPRLLGIDVARAVALLGIVVVHVLGQYSNSGELPTGYILGNSVAPALFALLAGTSLALVTGGAHPFEVGEKRRNASIGTVVRGVFIALVGLVLASLASGIAVILTYFGVLFMAAIPFLWLSSKRLCIMAFSFMIAMPLISYALRPSLPPRIYDAPQLENFSAPLQLLSHLFITGYYPVATWMGYLLLGLALGRMELSSSKVQLRMGIAGVSIAAVAWATSKFALSLTSVQALLLESSPYNSWAELLSASSPGLYGTVPTDSKAWLLVMFPHSGTPFDLLYTAGFSVAALMVILAMCHYVQGKSAVASEILRIAFGAGAMTLTLYSLHVVMHSPVLPPADVPSTFPIHVWVLCTVGAIFALARRRGPLEYLAGSLMHPAAIQKKLR